MASSKPKSQIVTRFSLVQDTENPGRCFDPTASAGVFKSYLVEVAEPLIWVAVLVGLLPVLELLVALPDSLAELVEEVFGAVDDDFGGAVSLLVDSVPEVLFDFSGVGAVEDPSGDGDFDGPPVEGGVVVFPSSDSDGGALGEVDSESDGSGFCEGDVDGDCEESGELDSLGFVDSDGLGDCDSDGFGLVDGFGLGFGTTGVSSLGTTTSGLVLVSSWSRTGGLLPLPFGALLAFTVRREESIIAWRWPGMIGR